MKQQKSKIQTFNQREIKRSWLNKQKYVLQARKSFPMQLCTVYTYVHTYMPMLHKCSCARILIWATEVTGTSGEKDRADNNNNGKTRVNTAALKKRSHWSKVARSAKWPVKSGLTAHACHSSSAAQARPGVVRVNTLSPTSESCSAYKSGSTHYTDHMIQTRVASECKLFDVRKQLCQLAHTYCASVTHVTTYQCLNPATGVPWCNAACWEGGR